MVFGILAKKNYHSKDSPLFILIKYYLSKNENDFIITFPGYFDTTYDGAKKFKKNIYDGHRGIFSYSMNPSQKCVFKQTLGFNFLFKDCLLNGNKLNCVDHSKMMFFLNKPIQNDIPFCLACKIKYIEQNIASNNVNIKFAVVGSSNLNKNNYFSDKGDGQADICFIEMDNRSEVEKFITAAIKNYNPNSNNLAIVGSYYIFEIQSHLTINDIFKNLTI